MLPACFCGGVRRSAGESPCNLTVLASKTMPLLRLAGCIHCCSADFYDERSGGRNVLWDSCEKSLEGWALADEDGETGIYLSMEA